MKLEAYDLALIAGAFTVLGALISGLVSYWLARLVAEHAAFIAAIANLRTAFGHQLAMLGAIAGVVRVRGIASKTISEGLAAQEAQMFSFRGFVSSRNLAAYDKACQEYSNLVRSLNNAAPPEIESHVFLSHIEAILKFTKP